MRNRNLRTNCGQDDNIVPHVNIKSLNYSGKGHTHSNRVEICEKETKGENINEKVFIHRQESSCYISIHEERERTREKGGWLIRLLAPERDMYSVQCLYADE